MPSTVSQNPIAIAESARVAKDAAASSRVDALESILPDGDNAVFGGGTAGGMWRSMLADRVSGVLAERGALGIAEMLTKTKEAQ